MTSWQVIGDVAKTLITTGSPRLGFALIIAFFGLIVLIFAMMIWAGMPEVASRFLTSAVSAGTDMLTSK